MFLWILGAGIAQWLERRTRDWKVAGSNPCWNGGRIFFSRDDFLCWLLFRYPFHPRVTTVARKKSRSFCQKCRWQVTAKTRIHLTYVAFIEPCFGIGHNLSLIIYVKWHLKTLSINSSTSCEFQPSIISWKTSLGVFPFFFSLFFFSFFSFLFFLSFIRIPPIGGTLLVIPLAVPWPLWDFDFFFSLLSHSFC